MSKMIDPDIAHLLETLQLDEELNAEFDGEESRFTRECSRLYATARRLAREAGYALPEAVSVGSTFPERGLSQ